MVLLFGGHAGSDVGRHGECPDLIAYTSQPYATGEGIRRRCGLLQRMESAGRVPEPLRTRILNELSNRFAAELDFTGTVAVPGRAIDYMLENMPETAALVSAYSGKEYTATQVDGPGGPERFLVSNETNFAANFTYLFSRESAGISEHMFFESGHATVLFWRVWGHAFVHYELLKTDGETSSYDIEVRVFTQSRVLRAILDSRLFGHFARRMFEGILKDIESAVHQLAGDSTPGDRLPSHFVTGLMSRLASETGVSTKSPSPISKAASRQGKLEFVGATPR